MSGLFSALKEKAQSASNQLASGFGRAEGAESPPAGQSQSQGGASSLTAFTKSHTFESLHHQLRTFQQQYSSSTTPVQKIITTSKGVAIDFDNVSRDAQAHSKELYVWGQTEIDDVKDVTDRLAWLSYMHGSLTGTLATKLNTSRTAFKHLRDAENALAPRRNVRIGLENQIGRIEHDQRKDQQGKLQELKAQLKKNQEEDAVAEKDIEILKRKAIRETEQEKWEAIREYAEKLSMVAQAALSVIPALPPIPPTKNAPYEGEQITGSVRASLQKALDSYSPGNIALIVAAPTGADLKHTRSFGVTHAQELSRINTQDVSVTGNIPITPPATTATAPPPHPSTFLPADAPGIPNPSVSPSILSKPVPLPVPEPAHSSSLGGASSPSSASPPLNPATLNQAPAPIPPINTSASSASPMVAPDPTDPSTKVPTVTPTVAETGVPKVAGPEGPGPSSGSLLDKNAPESPRQANPFGSPGAFRVASDASDAHAAAAAAAASGPSQFESAEDEKKRLEREEREKILHGTTGPSSGTTSQLESAEEEKKRLEREERERILHEGGSDANKPPGDGPSEDLPPYQEF